MRRFHALAVSLLLVASPAVAQEAVSDAAAPATSSAPAENSAPAQAPVALDAPRHDKRLDVDRDQARQNLSTATSQKHAASPLTGHPWWWLVTAVAVGVIIAVVVAG